MITTLALLLWLQNPPQVGPVQPPGEKPAPAPVQAPADKPTVVETPVAGDKSAAGMWLPVDGISLIVNEEAVTTDDFVREIRRRARQVTTEKDRNQAVQTAASELVARLLKIQAGKDLGFDEKMVDRLVHDDMNSTVEAMGSVMKLGTALDEFDMDPQMLRDDKKANIYRQLYEGDIDGRMAGPEGRVHVDRYVRPGSISLEYERRFPIDTAPTSLTLQELILPSENVGGSVKALERAKELHDRAAAGEDFTKLIDEFGFAPPNTHGISGPHEMRVLRQVPELSEFFKADLKVGDLSGPLPIRVEGELRGYRLFKVLEIKVSERPAFNSRETQDQLRQVVENRITTFRRDRALSALLEAAYVWPREAFNPPKPEPQEP